jgi:hypothetical protein
LRSNHEGQEPSELSVVHSGYGGMTSIWIDA